MNGKSGDYAGAEEHGAGAARVAQRLGDGRAGDGSLADWRPVGPAYGGRPGEQGGLG
jgi:hypothetical protein